MRTRLGIILGLICIVLTACEKPIKTLVVPTTPPGPSQTWIDAPQTNSTHYLQPLKLSFHGASFVGITEFIIEINGNFEAAVPPLSTSSGGAQYGTLFLSEYSWTPPAAGPYQIQVRAKGNGVLSPPDQVQITVTDSDFDLADNTPPIKDSYLCFYTAFINQFCRRGPGSEFAELDSFIPEQTAPVIGQSPDGSFWYVIGPNQEEVCTVPVDNQYGEVKGDCEMLPIYTPMPEQSAPGCTVRQAGGEIICVSPCPDNAAPGEPCTP